MLVACVSSGKFAAHATCWLKKCPHSHRTLTSQLGSGRTASTQTVQPKSESQPSSFESPGSETDAAVSAWAPSEKQQEAKYVQETKSAKLVDGPMFDYVPEDVIKEFERKIQGDLQSVGATLIAGIGVIMWWRGVWALLDHYIGEDSVFGHWMCIFTGLMIILYIRVSGLKLTNFFPPS